MFFHLCQQKELRACGVELQDTESIRELLLASASGNVNGKTHNLEKTTSSVISVIVNYKVYLNRIQIHRQKKYERAKDGIYV